MPKRFHDCGILHIWAFSESACLDLELSVSYSTTRDGYLVGWVRVGSFSAWVCLAASSVCLFSLWNWNVPKVEWAVQFSRNTCAGSAVGYTRWCSRVVLRFQVNVVRANCVARKHSSGVRGYKQNTVCTPWEALESIRQFSIAPWTLHYLEPSQKRTHGDRVDWNTFSLTNATRPLVSFFVSFGNCNLYVAHLVVSNYKNLHWETLAECHMSKNVFNSMSISIFPFFCFSY